MLVREFKDNSGLLSNVTHELRSPICSVFMMVDLLKNRRDFDFSDGDFDRFLDLMAKSCSESLALIDDLIVSCKKGVDDFVVGEASVVDFCELVDDVIESNQFRLLDNEIKISKEISGDLPQFRADYRRLKQVLNNLVSNAVKYSAFGADVVVKVFNLDGKIFSN